MAQQRRQQRWRGSASGVLRLVAVLLALISLCPARAGAAAAPSSSPLAGAAPASASEHGVATALENALTQEKVARGHSTASTAAEEDEGVVVLERVAMESTEDYDFPSANRKHAPHP